MVERGEYIFRAAGCVGCHTDADNNGPFLAGGREFETPFGTFFSPNITPDGETGIGRWTEAEFIAAMTKGTGPGWRHYYPVFPYTSYTHMGRDDLRALWAYLRQVQPAAQANRPHDLPWYLSSRLVNWAWKLLFFEPGPFVADPARSLEWNRGAYIATALAHCGECHTPRDRFGVLDASMRFAGGRQGIEGPVPNITPHRQTGIGRWSMDDLVYYLGTGADPGGDYAGDLMAEVIDNGLKHLSEEDLRGIATYVLSLPAIENEVGRKRTKSKRDEFEY